MHLFFDVTILFMNKKNSTRMNGGSAVSASSIRRRKKREKKRRRNRAIRILVVIILILLGATLAIGIPYSRNQLHLPISSHVTDYEDTINEYAKEYGVSEYTGLIEAVMMQESKGRGNDPMQAAEGNYNTQYPKRPGGIQNPEYSIDCGVHQLADALEMAGCTGPEDQEKVMLALQGYNFGDGYITWAIENYGGYSEENAEEFAELMKKSLKTNTYGDKHYVKHVMRYYSY